MADFIRAMLDQASKHAALVLVCVILFAAIDAAPGSDVIMAAFALSDQVELVAVAIIATAVGAFAGDHFGFALGRIAGPRVGESKLIQRLGRDRWVQGQPYAASRLVTRIIARLLPAIRTFVAAAAGASAMPYRRFTAVCGLAAALWATGWEVCGAVVGNALLDMAEQYSLLTVTVVVAVVIITVLVRRQSTRRLI